MSTTTVTSSESSGLDLENISNLELLSEVKKAIRAILIGGQSYKIGSRSLTRADLNALRDLKKELESEIAADAASNTGLLDDTYAAFFDRR